MSEKITNDIKNQLAEQLDNACSILKTLEELGERNIFGDKRFAEHVRVLNIGGGVTSTPARITKKSGRGRGRVTGKMTTNEAILKALADGSILDIPTLEKKASQHKGVSINKAALNQGLNQLKKKKAIKSAGRGKYQKA